MNKSRLPKGYKVSWKSDLLVLRRPDGSEVAVFSDAGASSEAIARSAWDDLRHGREPRSATNAKRGSTSGISQGRREQASDPATNDERTTQWR